MGKAAVKDRTLGRKRTWYGVFVRNIHDDETKGRELAKFKALGDAYQWASYVAPGWPAGYVIEIR